jgi:hypothetical protein
MAVISGARYTWSDSVNEKIDMSSALDILRPTDTPLLKLIGRDSLRDACTAVKHEWLEDEVRGLASAVKSSGTSLNNTTDPVSFDLSAANEAYKFRVQDIIKVDDELMRVTAIVDSDSITVSRGWGGSTAAAHADSSVVLLVAPALAQGQDLLGARSTTKVALYNYTQIFEEEVRVSATNAATAKYAAGSDTEREIAKQFEALGVNMERTLLYGRKVQPTSALAAGAGAMDGILARLSTNVFDKSAAALTETMLTDAIEAMWVLGAEAVTIVTNSTQKRRINTFADAFREMPYAQTKYGATVQRFETDFGEVKLLLDRHMPANQVLIINEEKIGFGPLSGRSLGITKLPPVSREYDTWQISGEYTAEVRLEKSHALIKNLATTGLF